MMWSNNDGMDPNWRPDFPTVNGEELNIEIKMQRDALAIELQAVRAERDNYIYKFQDSQELLEKVMKERNGAEDAALGSAMLVISSNEKRDRLKAQVEVMQLKLNRIQSMCAGFEMPEGWREDLLWLAYTLSRDALAEVAKLERGE